MKTKTTRLKTPVTLDITLEQAECLAFSISKLMIAERKLLADHDEEVKAVHAKYSTRLKALQDDIDRLYPQLQSWAEANHATYFKKKKSIEWLHSIIGFHTGQPKLALLKGWSWKTVLEKLRSWNPDFIRQKEEVDRQAILADRKRLEAQDTLTGIGLRISQTETFYLDPKATEPEAAQAPSPSPERGVHAASHPNTKAA